MNAGLRRVYSAVTLIPAAECFPEIAAGFALALDDKPVRTPAKSPLVLPTEALVAAIAAEWVAQGDRIRPYTMPMMSLACTAIDRAAPNRERMVEDIVAYGGTDLVCYRADGPADLVQRQIKVWQPLVDWVALVHDAPLTVTAGIVPLGQPATALRALTAAVAGFDDFGLAGLSLATSTAGSLVIALALASGRLDGGAAFDAAQLDENYQIAKWGEDAEAAERRREIRADLAAVERFWVLLRR
ncbi:MAG: ATPase [Alphaproteobacteria bacterium]|nr:ATPase [Alphaproteobacteria bacterium]